MKYSWKGPKDRNRHENRIKRSGQARLVYVRHKLYHPHHVKMSPREQRDRQKKGSVVVLVVTARSEHSTLHFIVRVVSREVLAWTELPRDGGEANYTEASHDQNYWPGKIQLNRAGRGKEGVGGGNKGQYTYHSFFFFFSFSCLSFLPFDSCVLTSNEEQDHGGRGQPTGQLWHSPCFVRQVPLTVTNGTRFLQSK